MAEEEGKAIEWPGGADEATDFDFLMVGKDGKPIMKIPKEKLNEVIVINGEGVKAVAGGATALTPTILRPGPNGQNRKMEKVKGWFVNGTTTEPTVATGTPWEAPEGFDNTNWWDGNNKVWSLVSSLPLPQIDTSQLVKNDDLSEGVPSHIDFTTILQGITPQIGYLDVSGNFVASANWRTFTIPSNRFDLEKIVRWMGRRGSSSVAMQNMVAIDGSGNKTFLISSNNSSVIETLDRTVPSGTIQLDVCFNGTSSYDLQKEYIVEATEDGKVVSLVKDVVEQKKIVPGLNPVLLNGTYLDFTFYNGIGIEQRKVDIAPAILKIVGTPLVKPSPFASVPMNFYKQNGVFYTDLDASKYDIKNDYTFYFAPDGSDLNDGLTMETAKKSILPTIRQLNASAPANGATFVFIGKENMQFGYNELCGEDINFKIAIKGINNPALMNYYQANFVNVAGSSAYYVQMPDKVSGILDKKYKNVMGDYKRLKQASSLDDCKATPGSYYKGQSTTTLYFHLYDSRQPDASVLPLRYSPLLNIKSDKCFISGVELIGAYHSVVNTGVINIDASSSNSKEYLITNCKVTFGMECVSVRTNGNTISILNNFYCTQSAEDNIGYYGSGSTTVSNALAIEINTRSYYGGFNNDGSNNGSTLHNSWNAIRVNSDFSYNENKNVADINNAKVWLLGVIASNATSPTVNVNYSFTDCEVWLDTCKKGGSITDLELVGGNNKIHFKDAVPSDWVRTGTGLIDTY